MGRQKNCGAAIILPTAPAWSLGLKNNYSNEAPGPGTGKYAQPGTLTSQGYAMGPPRAPKKKEANDASPVSDLYALNNKHGPEWSFGLKHPQGNPQVPGPGEYNFGDKARQKAIYGNSWGPPPRPRPPSAPPPGRMTSSYPGDKRLGPSIGLPLQRSNFVTPAPHDYQPFCSYGCRACDYYRGPSFGIRHNQHNPSVTPAPNQYHVACSTLGAAAKGCRTGDVPDRWTTQPSKRAVSARH